jgi:toxin ParE1/3/4
MQDDVPRDLEEIAGYIAEDSPSSSIRFVNQVLELIERLVELPGMGALRDYGDSALAGLRVANVPGFRNYGVYYLTTSDAVIVLRVVHGARDLDAIFAPVKDDT